ncbi:MAG: XTP/dITP diphosphatase [Deltaproteobacteria bacterium]|nr:MAG: XTP/dITP diphosphatase [Deltaproteobacteria bacterium]
MKIVVATSNAGKLKEIARLLADQPVELINLADLDSVPEIVEDGDTFAANAEKKALTVARATGQPTLADDSGLTVAALGGAPGVHSARYAGENADDAANNRRLLQELEGVPESERSAAFVCDLAFVLPDGRCWHFTGKMAGRILNEGRGTGGFGYDPLFYLEEHGCTLAEMPLDRKNAISHRGQALRRFREALPKLLRTL